MLLCFSMNINYPLYCAFFLLVISACNSNEIDQVKSSMLYFKNHGNPSDTIYIQKMESAYHSYKQNKQYDSCATLLINVGKCLYSNAMSNERFKMLSFDYLNQSESNSNSPTHYELSNMLACNYASEGKADSALIWFKRGMNKMSGERMQKANGFACSETGLIYLSKSQLDSAEKYCLSAIRSFEQIKDSANLSVNYLQLSSIFQSLHAWNIADTYINQSITYLSNSKDTDLHIGAYNVKAMMHLEGLKDTASFIHILEDSRHLYSQYTAPSLYLQFIENSLFFEQSIYQKEELKAKVYLDKCDSLSNVIQNEGIQTQFYYLQSVYALNYQDALVDENKIDSLANLFEQNKSFVYATRLFDALRTKAQKKSNLQSALKYNLAFQRCKDSLYIQDKDGQIIASERKFQTAKKEKTIAEQNSKIQKSKFQISALLLSLIGIVLTGAIFFSYRKRKEARAEIKRQEEFTYQLLQNTEEERSRIASELHDGINHELLTVKNKLAQGKTIQMTEVEKIIDDVRSLSRDLHPAMFETIGLAASIESLCERLTEVGLFTTCEINYTLKLSKRNELQLYRIIQEALNNTLKHAKANAAKVTIDTKDNELLVEIKDNGIGFDTDEKMKSASSFGIQSLLQRAKAIGGKSTFESNETGTKLILKTPIH